MTTQSRWHPGLRIDLELLLLLYSPDPEEQAAKEATIAHVSEIIRASEGDSFSVANLSIFAYARDILGSNIDLVITDSDRKQGISPDEDVKNLSKLYQAKPQKALANIITSTPSLKNAKSGFRSVISVTPEAPMIPFTISPPSPCRIVLLDLLRAYCNVYPPLRELISFIHLWAQSHQLAGITPLCLSLMTIAYLQAKDYIPNLQDPEVGGEEILQNGVWKREEKTEDGNTRVASVWCQTGFGDGAGWQTARFDVADVLAGWFQFWRDPYFSAMKHVVSIRSGGLRRRQRLPENPYRKAKPEAQESTAEQPAPAEKEAKVTAEPPSTQESEDGWVEPEEWVNAKFVVQNPFVLTYNHGSTVKGPEVDRFYSLTRVSFEKLESGMPLSSILGADLPSRHFTEPLHPSLAVDIRNLFDSMQPPTDVLNARNRTLARLKRIIQSNFGNGYDVACFGSTVYGVDSPTSDLDVVIIDKARSDGFAPAINLKRLPRIYDVLHLAAIFRREGFVKVSSVPWASVPIVKLTDPDTGLQVDINVNDQLGLCNTILLRCYCALIPSLRPLVSLIKRWAKSHGLNDPGAQNGPATFSSYCLVLMTVGLLQSKGIAPSLQQGFEDIPEGDGGFWMRTVSGEKVWCDTRFHDGQGVKIVDISVDNALIDWFRYWAHEHQYEDRGMSIEKGGITHRQPFSRNLRTPKKEKKSKSSKGGTQPQDIQQAANGTSVPPTEDTTPETSAVPDKPTDGGDEQLEQEPLADKDVDLTMRLGEGNQEPSTWQRNPLLVQDPFIRAKNAAGAITENVLKRFKSECARSLMILESGGSLDLILGRGNPVGGPKPDRGHKGGQGQKKKKPPGRKAEEKGKQAEGKGKQVEGGGKQMEGKVKQAGGDGNDEAVAGASTQAVKAGGAGSRGGGTRNRRRDGQGKSADGPSRRSGNANPPAKSGGENRRRTRNPKAPPASSGKAGSQRNGVGAVERGPMLNNTQAAQGQ